jgi:hypothetical protein
MNVPAICLPAFDVRLILRNIAFRPTCSQVPNPRRSIRMYRSLGDSLPEMVGILLREAINLALSLLFRLNSTNSIRNFPLQC